MRDGLVVGLGCLALCGLVGCSDDDPTIDPGEIKPMQVQVGDLKFDARTAGPDDGELVILLHGFPETSYEWRHQLRALGTAGYRAVAPDQRGYSVGARPSEVSDYDVAKLIGDILALADELGAQRFHLVGHDWGAAVAWGVGAVAADRVLSLSTVSVPHPDAFNAELADTGSCQYEASAYFDFFLTPSAEDFFLANDAAQLRAIYEGVSADAIDEYVRVLGSEEALGAALNWYRANVADRQFKGGALGDISVPTLFIWSDGDSAICQEGADATGDYVTGPYNYQVLTGGINHWVPEIASDDVSRLLLEHVAGGS